MGNDEKNVRVVVSPTLIHQSSQEHLESETPRAQRRVNSMMADSQTIGVQRVVMMRYKTDTEDDEDGTPKQNIDELDGLSDSELTSSSSVVDEEERLEIAKLKDVQSKQIAEEEQIRDLREATMRLQADDERAMKTQLSSMLPVDVNGKFGGDSDSDSTSESAHDLGKLFRENTDREWAPEKVTKEKRDMQKHMENMLIANTPAV